MKKLIIAFLIITSALISSSVGAFSVPMTNSAAITASNFSIIASSGRSNDNHDYTHVVYAPGCENTSTLLCPIVEAYCDWVTGCGESDKWLMQQMLPKFSGIKHFKVEHILFDSFQVYPKPYVHVRLQSIDGPELIFHYNQTPIYPKSPEKWDWINIPHTTAFCSNYTGEDCAVSLLVKNKG